MLSMTQRNILKKAGFTQYEINQWNNTKTNFNHPKFQAMITTRAKYCTRLLKNGWTQDEIINGFTKFLRIRRGEGERNAWADFLESEYDKISGSNKLSEKDLSNQIKLRKALTKVFGRNARQKLINKDKKIREARAKAMQTSYLPPN